MRGRVIARSARPGAAADANAVRLRLDALAYSAGNFMRTLAMPKAGKAVVADEPAGEADQDRHQGPGPRPLPRFADGRSRGAASETPGRLPLCLAEEAGTAHPVAGNPGHPGDVDCRR